MQGWFYDCLADLICCVGLVGQELETVIQHTVGRSVVGLLGLQDDLYQSYDRLQLVCSAFANVVQWGC